MQELFRDMELQNPQEKVQAFALYKLQAREPAKDTLLISEVKAK